jgi:hypothetical protein
MAERLFESWRISRARLSQYLRAYDEIALSVRALTLPTAQHEEICELTVKYALWGIPLYRAAALAAVYVLEGQRRELKLHRPLGIESSEPHVEEDISARLAEYSLGRSLKKREVFDGVAEMITPLLHGFRYYRSYGQFRRPFANGMAFVQLCSHRWLFKGFTYGIHHRPVEEAFARLLDPERKLHKWSPITIFDESKYHNVDWPISGSHGLELAAEGMKTFVHDIVLPHLRSNEEPEAIRKTILYADGCTPWTWGRHATVFAVDALLGQRSWLEDDFDHYRRYYKAGSPAAEDLNRDYEIARKNWDAVVRLGP